MASPTLPRTSVRRSLHAVGTLALLALPLLAQTAPPPAPTTTAAPDATAPHVVIDTVGPDGWRTRFGPTRIGSLLASERGRELWQPLRDGVFAQWQGLLGGDANAFDGSRDRWLGYGGRVQIALWFAKSEHGDPVPHHGIVTLHPDGRTDMAALGKDLATMQGALGEATRVSLGGEFVRVREFEAMTISEPVPAGGGLVMVLAPADAVATLLPTAVAAPTIDKQTPLPNTPALRVQMAVPELIALATGGDPDELRELAAFGFTSLTRLEASLGTAGPHVQWELVHHFPNGPRGLFAALCPTRPGLSTLTALLPADAAGARVGRFDFAAAFATFLDVLQVMPFAEKPDTVRAELRKDLGLDLGDDLFAHMTDEVALVGCALREIDRGSDLTWVLAAKLRDTAKFRAGLETLLKHAKPHVQHAETVAVGDVELKRYGNLLQYDVWMAVGHDVCFLAGGRDAEAQLTALVQAAGKPAEANAALPTRHRDLARAMPPGLQGVAYLDVGAYTVVPGSLWSMVLREFVPGFAMLGADELDGQSEAVRALLQEHQLTTVRTATGHADGVWRWRLWW